MKILHQKIPWLFNYNLKPIKKVGGAKGKILSLFKTNTTKEYSKPTHIKNVHGGVKKNKLKNKNNLNTKSLKI